MKLNEFFREGDMRFPELGYDKYGMHDYSVYTDVITRLVQRGMGKVQIQRELQARFHVMARDARSLIQRWEQENKQPVRSQTRIDAEAGGGGGGGAGGGAGAGAGGAGASAGGDGGSTGSSGDSGSADSGVADTGDSNSPDSTPTAEPRGVGAFFAYGLRPSKNSKKKKKKKKSSSGFDFGKGVYERKDMPQINEQDLLDAKIPYKKGFIKTENIVTVQKDRSKKMHKKAFEKITSNNYDPLVIDENNVLINGHHRLDVVLELNKKYVKAIKVEAKLDSLMETFAHTTEDVKTYRRSNNPRRGRSQTFQRNHDIFKNPRKDAGPSMLDVMVPGRGELDTEWNYSPNQSPIENFTHWYQEKRKDPKWMYDEQESWKIFKDKYKDMM